MESEAVEAAGMTVRRRRNGRVVFAVALAVLALNLRPTIASIGPLLGFIQADLELSNAAAALLTTIPVFCMGAFALPAPALARLIGRNQLVLAGLFLIGGATILRALATSQPILLFATLAIGIGIGVVGALMGGFIKDHFADRPSLFMGFYAAALSLGGTIAAGIALPIAQAAGDDGWRWSAAIWALLIVPAAVVWLAAARSEVRGLAKTPSPTIVANRLPWTERLAIFTGLLFALQNFVFYSVLAWLAPFLLEEDRDGTAVGILLASFVGTFMLSNLAIGGFAESRTDRRPLLGFSALLIAGGLAAILFAPQGATLLAIAACAVGLAGTFTLGQTLPLDQARSPGEANARTAMTLTIGYILGAPGPLVVGWLRDLTGSVSTGLVLLMVLGIAMLALVPVLGPRKPAVQDPKA